MSDPKIVASAKSHRHPGSMPQDSSGSWLVLGWIGLVFLVVGGMDFALVWTPPNFGSPEWEFGTVTQSFNGLPILLLGLGLLTVASEQGDRGWWGALGMVGSGVLLIWVLVGAALWSMTVPLALETAPAEVVLDIRRAIAKTLVQAIAYTLALSYLVWRAWTARRTRVVGESG